MACANCMQKGKDFPAIPAKDKNLPLPAGFRFDARIATTVALSERYLARENLYHFDSAVPRLGTISIIDGFEQHESQIQRSFAALKDDGAKQNDGTGTLN